MPIDPLIANPATVKINDPLEQYGNYLRYAQMKGTMDQTRRANQIRNVLAEGYRLTTDPDGVTDFNALRSYAAQHGIGDAIPSMLEDEVKRAKTGAEVGKLKAETGFKEAETGKTKAETDTEHANAFAKTLDNYKQALPGISTDPNEGIPQLINWTLGQFKDPILGPMLRAQGKTPEQAIEQLKASLKSMPYDKFLLTMQIGPDAATKQTYQQQNLQDRIVTKAMPEHSLGTPTVTNVSTEKMGSNPDAGKNSTKISINNIPAQVESAYGKEFAGLTAKQDSEMLDAARRAPELASRADRVLSAIENGNVITGAGAPLMLNMAKVLNIAGASDKEMIANTEVLVSDLAKNTLDNIRASGLGGGNGFTDKDREFLEKAVGGVNTLSAEGIRRLAKLSRQAAEQSAKKWNERVRSIPPSAIRGTGLSTNPIQVPNAAGTPMKGTNGRPISQKSIEELRKDPSAAAEFDAYFGAGSASRVLGGK